MVIGPPGAGKSAALAALSDAVVGCSAFDPKVETGAIRLGLGAHLRLVAAGVENLPDTMWEPLLPTVAAVVVLIDASRADPAADLAACLAPLRARHDTAGIPTVVGVTRAETAGAWPWLAREAAARKLPVLDVDARDARDVRLLLMVAIAMLEMTSRIPRRQSS